MYLNPHLIPLPKSVGEDDLCCHFKIKRSKIGVASMSSLIKSNNFAGVTSFEDLIRIFQKQTTFVGCQYASSDSKKHAFTLFYKEESIKFCNPDHIDIPLIWSYTKHYLGVPKNGESIQFEANENDVIQEKCKGCRKISNGTIAIRGLRASNLESSNTYFCSIECFYHVCSGSKCSDFQAIIEKGIIKNNKKNKKKDNGEEEDEDNKKNTSKLPKKTSKKKDDKKPIVTRSKSKQFK